MQQLQFMKDMIATKLNHRLKEDVVKNIFFTVGRIEMAEDPAPPPIDSNDQRQLNDQFIAEIADPEIRTAFKKLWKSYSGRQPKT